MRLIGIPGKWFPSPNFTHGVLLADHRYGAEASVSITNDSYSSMESVYWAESLAFKYNLKLTTFINSDPAYYKNEIYAIEKTGKIHHDLYFMTDKWVNPISGVYETIPDYYSTTWTSAGAAAFSNAVSGQAKPSGTDGKGSTIITNRYPSHGQQMYDISGGAYGYNFPTDTFGGSALSELKGLDEFMRVPLELELGRKISTYAYRNGITAQSWLLKDIYLGGRNSSGRLAGAALTSYGFKEPGKTEKLGEFFYSDSQISTNPDLGWTDNHHLNRQNTVQFESYLTSHGAVGGTYDSAYTAFETYLTELFNGNGTTIKNLFTSGGWFQEFTHWANMYQGAGWAGTKGDIRYLYEAYLSKVNGLLAGHFVHKAGYGEIVEYHTLRDSVRRVDLYDEGTGIRIGVRTEGFSNTWSTPVSVIIDLTGTAFAGLEFKPGQGCSGIRKISESVFSVDVLVNGLIVVDPTGDYYNFSTPLISAVLTGTVLEITSNIPTKVVVYSKGVDGMFTEVSRDNELSTLREIETGGLTNLYVGAASDLGSALLTV